LLRALYQQILHLIARIGSDPNDSDEVRLQKTLLPLGSFMFVAAGALWGIIYFSFGEYITRSIPLGYVIISAISILNFHLKHPIIRGG
jgi:hypothetical protein